MKILKFGGKSLQPGKPLDKAISIIKNEQKQNRIAVVVSALADSTDRLVGLYDRAVSGDDFIEDLEQLKSVQNANDIGLDISTDLESLKTDLEKIRLSGKRTRHAEDTVLSYGELLSAKIITQLLQNTGLDSKFVDARKLLKGKLINDEFSIDRKDSENNTVNYFKKIDANVVPVITGFIASDCQNQTVTLGRNGTNYSTSLFANFLGAEEVQNWTDVNGIYAASPKLVPEAERISNLSYKEAHELANFGAKILHPKTIGPLMEKDIPLKIYNSFSDEKEGTTVSRNGAEKGIKAVNVIEDVALISIEGKGLQGRIGIDARIFGALSKKNISVRLISQASSERGIGFVVDEEYAKQAVTILSEEFAKELLLEEISGIKHDSEMAIIAIVGRHNYALEKAIKGLRRNKIWMHLISNSISGEHISLVIDNRDIKKAVRIVHSQVFGVIKTVNLFAIGKGLVGGNLLDQILLTSDSVEKRRNLRVRIIGVADSEKFVVNPYGLNKDWRTELSNGNNYADLNDIIAILNDSALENIIIADNTSSQRVADFYPVFLKNQFDIVASNKKGNSGSFQSYKEIRKLLNRRGRLFNYETNVGAGLPIIDTIKYLFDSADQITSIKGVFSGSISYLFNNFSVHDKDFSSTLLDAREKGLTEPDPREDLSGEDVARKLVILARELGLETELQDIKLDSLIPENLVDIGDFDEFLDHSSELNEYYSDIKNKLKDNEVLRYVADLDVLNEKLKISLEKVKKDSPLGGIKNSDALFEIYTESYGDQPFIIQGAGAGGAVTARGVYSDLIRMGHKY